MNYSCSFFYYWDLQRKSSNADFPFHAILWFCIQWSQLQTLFLSTFKAQQNTNRIHFNLFPFLIFFSFSPFSHAIHSSITGGPLGLFIIFPEPIFGPPFTASNCDIKRRTICWTPNTNRIHVQRWSKCTVLSAFCSLEDSRIVEGNYQHHSYCIRFNCYWPLTRLCNNCLCFFFHVVIR